MTVLRDNFQWKSPIGTWTSVCLTEFSALRLSVLQRFFYRKDTYLLPGHVEMSVLGTFPYYGMSVLRGFTECNFIHWLCVQVSTRTPRHILFLLVFHCTWHLPNRTLFYLFVQCMEIASCRVLIRVFKHELATFQDGKKAKENSQLILMPRGHSQTYRIDREMCCNFGLFCHLGL